MTESRPPSGLKTPGKRLWVDVTAIYVLTPAELAVLREACGTADELGRLGASGADFAGVGGAWLYGSAEGASLVG